MRLLAVALDVDACRRATATSACRTSCTRLMRDAGLYAIVECAWHGRNHTVLCVRFEVSLTFLASFGGFLVSLRREPLRESSRAEWARRRVQERPQRSFWV